MPASAPTAVSSCRRIAWWAEKTERYSAASKDDQRLGMFGGGMGTYGQGACLGELKTEAKRGGSRIDTF